MEKKKAFLRKAEKREMWESHAALFELQHFNFICKTIEKEQKNY